MDRQKSLNKSAWVMLCVGFVACVFSGGRWNVGVTAWIWPFAFLYFSRQTKTKGQFLLLTAAIAAGHVIKWPDILDSGYLIGAVFCLFWSVCWILPFLTDRLLAQKLPGSFLSSLIFPAAFVSVEALRALTPIGSLGAMAYTQAGNLPLMQVASLIGSFGLSFLIYWFGAVAVTAAEKRPRWKPAAGVCLALLAASVCFGCIRLAAFPVGSENTVRVASVVSPYYEKYEDGTYEEIPTEESLRYFLREAQRAAQGGAEIACWNEEAFSVADADEHLLVDAAAAFAKEHGMILIVGYETPDTDGSENGESVNKTVLVLPDGSVTEYIKTNLIPLVEIPGYVKGSGAVPCVQTDAGVIANVICFDDTFIGFVREKAGAADVLFVPSWDWRGVKRAHTELSAFRAVENGFAVVKPSYDGVSAAIDRQGRVLGRFDTADTGFDTVQFSDVPLKGVPTVYAKIGGAVDLVFLLSGFVATALGLAVLRRNKQEKGGRRMKRMICAVMVLLMIGLSLCGCSKEDPAKAEMQAMAGENQQITGDYDEALAAVCHNGTFVGQQEGNVIAFKGVPFAEPPVGARRWKPPVPAAAGNGVYEAKYFGKSPVQSEWVSEPGSYYPQSEDCLTLNVWTNAAGPREGKTVMVFFHGGSYGWGAASDPIYDGHNLVEKYPDLVLVTVEYRLGIFGFIDFSEVPGGDKYAESGNLGLLDQVCALQWVRDNIEAFGGDPENVTIFGESAGAGSVSLLPLMAGTQGLFKRIIAESGSVTLTYGREECRNLTQMLLDKSGCATMDELTALSEETLKELNESLNDYNNFPERDGVVLPEDLYAAWEDDSLAEIDLLIGTNSDETRYWVNEMGYYTPLPGMFVYEHMIPFMYENNLKRMSPEERALTKDFVREQSGKKIWRLTEFYNELLFRVPALEQAARHKGTTYSYYWTMPGADETLGACHAIELAYVFNNPQADIYTGGRYDEALADTVQDMWVHFARTGDPSTDGHVWAPYTVDSRKTMVLGEDTGMVEDLKREQRETISPLLRHYFNGCYSQLDFFVPQLGRIVGTVLCVPAVVIAAVVLLRRRKKRKNTGK